MNNIVIYYDITLGSPLIIEGTNQTRHHKNTIFCAICKIVNARINDCQHVPNKWNGGMNESIHKYANK
jgi:hypothetical protein